MKFNCLSKTVINLDENQKNIIKLMKFIKKFYSWHFVHIEYMQTENKTIKIRKSEKQFPHMVFSYICFLSIFAKFKRYETINTCLLSKVKMLELVVYIMKFDPIQTGLKHKSFDNIYFYFIGLFTASFHS